jgi:hypothetical protein
VSEEDFIIEEDFLEDPEYPSPISDGNVVTVHGTLCNTNSCGGTTILKHDGVECQVTKSFWDYETGWGYHGRVVDPDLVEDFRAQSWSDLDPEYYREKYPNQPEHYEGVKAAHEKFDPGYVYFSEHDLAPRPKYGNR